MTVIPPPIEASADPLDPSKYGTCPGMTMGSTNMVLSKDFTYRVASDCPPLAMCIPTPKGIKKGTKLTGFLNCHPALRTTENPKGVTYTFLTNIDGENVRIPMANLMPDVEGTGVVPPHSAPSNDQPGRTTNEKSPDPKKLIILVLLAIGVVFIYKNLITEK
jgi:hypothetical protein